MKASELRSKSKDELNETLLQLQKERFNLRFQRTTGTVENTARIRSVRRDIARIQTILSTLKSGKPSPAKKPAKPAAKKKAKE